MSIVLFDESEIFAACLAKTLRLFDFEVFETSTPDNVNIGLFADKSELLGHNEVCPLSAAKIDWLIVNPYSRIHSPITGCIEDSLPGLQFLLNVDFQESDSKILFYSYESAPGSKWLKRWLPTCLTSRIYFLPRPLRLPMILDILSQPHLGYPFPYVQSPRPTSESSMSWEVMFIDDILSSITCDIANVENVFKCKPSVKGNVFLRKLLNESPLAVEEISNLNGNFAQRARC